MTDDHSPIRRLPDCPDDEHGARLTVLPKEFDTDPDRAGFVVDAVFCVCLSANGHRGANLAAECLIATLKNAMDEAAAHELFLRLFE